MTDSPPQPSHPFPHLPPFTFIPSAAPPARFIQRVACVEQITASLFGVGAPEALVIGVVALLVFGPKGLADIAKQLGSTLRAFQPTIRELQEVSREFKETLSDEIGLDEIRNPPVVPKKRTPDVDAAPLAAAADAVGVEAGDAAAAAAAAGAAATSSAAAAVETGSVDDVTEEMKKAAAEAAWGVAAPPTPAPAQTEVGGHKQYACDPPRYLRFP
jgi:TatA/E family protein of Tat protein translocase